YDVYLIDITTDGWYYKDEQGNKYAIDKDDFSVSLNNVKIKFDVAFIILHGTPGDGGRLQGYFDMIGLPYTSCNALTSALTMNKGYTKAILADIPELNVAKSVLLFENHRAEAAEIVQSKLQLPYFVKPNAGGSSIGMSKVKRKDALQGAVGTGTAAESRGGRVVVEAPVGGRGLWRRRCSSHRGDLVVWPATEVRTPRRSVGPEGG